MDFIRAIDIKARGRHVDLHPLFKNAGSVNKFDGAKLLSHANGNKLADLLAQQITTPPS